MLLHEFCIRLCNHSLGYTCFTIQHPWCVLSRYFWCFDRECTRGGFCNFMHLKPISRELRRELYGRRRKRFKNHFKSKILARVVSQIRLFPSGTDLAHAPENGVPAPGTDDGIVKDEGRGIESAMEGSKQAPTDVPPRPSPFPPSCDDKFIFLSSFFCQIVASVFLYFLF